MNQLIITYYGGKLALIENHAAQGMTDPARLVILSVQCLGVEGTLPAMFALNRAAMEKLKSFVDDYFRSK